jgi:acyl-CoA thioesterase
VQLIGAREEEWREGYVRLAVTLEAKHTNPHGVVHGGVLSTLTDEATGGVIASVRGMEEMWAAPHSTVDMSVSFLGSARAGDEILIEARVLKLGRSIAFGEAEVRKRGSDALIAKARFTFSIRQPRS